MAVPVLKLPVRRSVPPLKMTEEGPPVAAVAVPAPRLPSAPTLTVPSLITSEPLNVLLADRTSVPGPDFTRLVPAENVMGTLLPATGFAVALIVIEVGELMLMMWALVVIGMFVPAD